MSKRRRINGHQHGKNAKRNEKQAGQGETFANVTIDSLNRIHMYFTLSDHYLNLDPENARIFAELIMKTANEAKLLAGGDEKPGPSDD